MEYNRHYLLSNHLDIEAIINKAFEHFLQKFEQKFARRISIKEGRFCDSSKGRLEEPDFQCFRINNECNQRKSWLFNFKDHHRLASRSHDDRQVEQLKRFGITATAIVWG